MKALDLCAGAGGLSFGLSAAGFEVLGVEKDEDAHATHTANVGPCILGDVRSFWPSPGFDLVAGGVPCQPYSICGSREGLNIENGRLYLEVIRVANLTNAKAVLLENVTGLLSWEKGRALNQILRDLWRSGFQCQYKLIDCSLYGVPQRRKRVFVVGTRDGLGPFIWPEPDRHIPTVRQALNLSGKFRTGISNKRQDSSHAQGQRYTDVDKPAYTIIAGTSQEWIYPENGNPYRYTVEQSAILQSFPKFNWIGTKTSQYQQIGNAVPPLIGYKLGRAFLRRWGQL